MTHPQIVVTVGATVRRFGCACVAGKKCKGILLKRGTRFFYFWPNPLLGWMKTSGYIIYLRVMGVVFLCFGLLVQFAALSDLKK